MKCVIYKSRVVRKFDLLTNLRIHGFVLILYVESSCVIQRLIHDYIITRHSCQYMEWIQHDVRESPVLYQMISSPVKLFQLVFITEDY